MAINYCCLILLALSICFPQICAFSKSTTSLATDAPKSLFPGELVTKARVWSKPTTERTVPITTTTTTTSTTSTTTTTTTTMTPRPRPKKCSDLDMNWLVDY